MLASAADPDASVHYLVSLRQQQPDAFHRLVRTPAVLKYLITVGSFSRFLSEEILQNPQWLEEVNGMNRVLTAAEYKKRLGKFLKDQPAQLSRMQGPWLYRSRCSAASRFCASCCATCWGLRSLSETTEELSNLADAILHISYKRIRAELVARHGDAAIRG